MPRRRSSSPGVTRVPGPTAISWLLITTATAVGLVEGALKLIVSGSNVRAFPSSRVVVACVPSSATNVAGTVPRITLNVTVPQVTATSTPGPKESSASPPQTLTVAAPGPPGDEAVAIKTPSLESGGSRTVTTWSPGSLMVPVVGPSLKSTEISVGSVSTSS